jgi:hypothetical protein
MERLKPWHPQQARNVVPAAWGRDSELADRAALVRKLNAEIRATSDRSLVEDAARVLL